MTEPFRRLEDKDAEWQHKVTFNTVKKKRTEFPVLKYYSVNDEVTIRCGASDTGLGAILLQKGQLQETGLFAHGQYANALGRFANVR